MPAVLHSFWRLQGALCPCIFQRPCHSLAYLSLCLHCLFKPLSLTSASEVTSPLPLPLLPPSHKDSG